MNKNTLRTAIAATAIAPLIAFGSGVAAAAPAPTPPAPETIHPVMLGPFGGACAPLLFIPLIGIPIAGLCAV
ncbi:hypothetical protein P3H15_39650 [Rhodococcus sp. T2V]|uniref:hypothetical protein n=1 Tax=Rhodococcus sp. T2V TaxID=3034164 RepID=UPI0023E26876|nr:hypothetical protein [Rhodococcus sp. T2V]MDF3311117.1 hypothetical protein [Rhodococcus sp. T2V]